MDRVIKLFGIVVGVIALFVGMALFAYLSGFQNVLLGDKLFSEANPIGVLAIFGILLFGGLYFFTAAGHIIKEAVK